MQNRTRKPMNSDVRTFLWLAAAQIILWLSVTGLENVNVPVFKIGLIISGALGAIMVGIAIFVLAKGNE